MTIILGIEGSANKLGVGIVRDGSVLANPRVTYITPPGEGFQPTETARFHQSHIIELVQKAIKEARVDPSELDAVAYTKVCLKKSTQLHMMNFFSDRIGFVFVTIIPKDILITLT
ncbi:hypothetical protein Smp_120900 [Schistosoma mansoni]|uniref:hypothetical protein n=1 Tax=Schistosoma mansoni TaxID=6183 RepID=UPI00022C84BA|nr:hypothetical protein Smp_120900 [Schistosoma mansoni]|eukprot:XP_018644639.1 hypothetical protein Smp_120900 [Schistosoma mansoni]